MIIIKIGYARVSSKDQNLARQLEALNEIGMDKIFEEKASGATIEKRPELLKMLKFVREGDIVYTQSLDRLGRNSADLKKLIQQIKDKGAIYQSLDLPDFSAVPDNNMRNMLTDLMLTLFGFIAENERKSIKERQRQGIKLAKERGVYRGRPVKYRPDSPDPRARRDYNDVVKMLSEGHTVAEIAREIGVSRPTVTNIKHEIASDDDSK